MDIRTRTRTRRRTSVSLAAMAAAAAGAFSLSLPAANAAPSAPAVDLHHVAWRQATVPGKACFASHPIRLHNGFALIPNKNGYPSPPSSTGPRYYRLSLDATFNKKLLVYGPLQGPGRTAAAVGLLCDNNGGTGAGELLASVAVYSGSGGKVHSLGLLTPQVQLPGLHCTLLGPFVVGPGRVTVTEEFYGPHDSDAEPTGRARTVWTYAGGTFHPHTTITQAPA